ncbi:MAG: FAD-dependent oxidoreductase [candidate division WOR-3 bacterium]|nr:FAD-dependent oxidoreductase [candidate division WOR-3 bacterium]MCX7947383.1 FAD-dependent oxidoreductase [candidate division WOR-3 bacterium]MDW8150061.1 FAD-dependent oxidoreductase [candidate division WOR-3 bacterium]
MKTRILILGGGVGGLVSANKISKILNGKAEITVIDKNPYHEFMASYPWVALGYKEPDDIRRPLSLLSKKNVNFINDEIVEIQPSKNKVITKNSEYEYDFCIVSLGAEVKEDEIPNFSEEAHHSWSLEGSLRLREAIKNFKGGNIVIGIAGAYYRCPPAPYEIAGQVDFFLRIRGVRNKSEITVFHITPGPMSNMGPAISSVISEILSNKGIKFVGNFEPVRIDKENKKVISKDGRELNYDLLIMTPPHKPNSVVAKSELSSPKGLPIVDPSTFRSKNFPNVFIIGDVVNPAINLPPAGVVAHFQAEFVSTQIAAEIKGTYVGDSFSPVAMCIMDFGDDALFPMCEFSKMYLDLSGPPSCGVLARGKEVKLIKMLFEFMWFANYLSK